VIDPGQVLQKSFRAVWTSTLGAVPDSGASALVVRDEASDPRVVAAAVFAARDLGLEVAALDHTPRSAVPMDTFGTFPSFAFDDAATAPYAVLNAAVAAADAVIVLSDELALLFNPSFRAAVRISRVAFLPYMDRNTAVRLLPANEAQAEELAHLTRDGTARLAGRHEIRLTSPSGTDLTMRLGQYKANCSAGSLTTAAGFGGLEVLPAGQIATVPDDGSVNVTLVVEGSLNFPRFERVAHPIELDIRESRVVGIKGGHHAAQLERALDAMAHLGVSRHVTELGIGTNRRCTFLGRYGPTEDTHRFATVSMALGADTHLGGRNVAGCHVDMALEETSVTVDGEPFLTPKGFAFTAAAGTGSAERRA
jgi:leucyl aminopeptidase (aminopeptidase T)